MRPAKALTRLLPGIARTKRLVVTTALSRRSWRRAARRPLAGRALLWLRPRRDEHGATAPRNVVDLVPGISSLIVSRLHLSIGAQRDLILRRALSVFRLIHRRRIPSNQANSDSGDVNSANRSRSMFPPLHTATTAS